MALFFAIALLALLIATLPVWPHSRGWGYLPAGLLATTLLLLLALVLIDRV